MSKKSKEARRKRREGVVTAFRDFLATFRAPSLLPLVEAAAISPTAAHRAPSLGRLFFDSVRFWPSGERDATAADLPALIAAVAVRNPEFAALEDSVPLDPRRDVRTDWGGQTFRLLPGGLERPVAMFERARMVDSATRQPLVAAFGFAVTDLADLVLTSLNETAPFFSTVCPPPSD